MEIIEKIPLQFKKSDFKLKWFHYILALPMITQWFLCWYLYQVLKLYLKVACKQVLKAFHRQKAIFLNWDESHIKNLNMMVDNVFNEYMKKNVIKVRKFERVAILGLAFTGICWTFLPQHSSLNISTMMIGTMVQRVPSAINETMEQFFKGYRK